MSMLLVAALFALLLLVVHGACRNRAALPQAAGVEAELDALYVELVGLEERSSRSKPVERVPDGLIVNEVRREGDLYFYVEDPSADLLVGYVVLARPGDLPGPAVDVCRVPFVRLRPGYAHDAILSSVYNHVLREGYCLMSGSDRDLSACPAWQRLEPLYVAADVGPLERYIRSTFTLSQHDAGVSELVLGHGWSARRFAQFSGLAVL